MSHFISFGHRLIVVRLWIGGFPGSSVVRLLRIKTWQTIVMKIYFHLQGKTSSNIEGRRNLRPPRMLKLAQC
jgi:hypothetical protein